MTIDKTIFTYEELDENYNVSTLFQLQNSISKIKIKLEKLKTHSIKKNDVALARLINEQVFFINKNLDTIDMVMTTKESDVFYDNSNGFEICLN
jgi:hypothetical protein